MIQINDPASMQAHALETKSQGRTIALVPTMGALHEGHLSLIDIARERADEVIVSIFINPAQFGPNEDFAAYPRTLEEDLEKCKEKGVHVAFTPETTSIYPPDYSVFVNEESLSQGLCGVSRPNHFRGVSTVCAKLFLLVQPNFAIFGQKDAQQVAIIKKMVKDLHFPVEILIGETVREEDGLAKSSRNQYLTPEQRSDAGQIFQSLEIARKMVKGGVRNVDRVIAEVTHHLGQYRRLRIIYVNMVNPETMKPVREIEPGKALLALAVWCDQTRLIDNILL